jgi:hypothetical protein
MAEHTILVLVYLRAYVLRTYLPSKQAFTQMRRAVGCMEYVVIMPIFWAKL